LPQKYGRHFVFFLQTFIHGLSSEFNGSSVYTKEVMPPKRAKVSAECVIANIMRFIERYDNNDTVTVM
jgi:hypothetical protein